MRFDLPPNYHGPQGFVLFEWLDDDTVALIASDNPSGIGWPGTPVTATS